MTKKKARPRAQRSDAERNRGLLISVARDLFTARGVGISVNDVAAAAGVGVGTLYRHFPTKEALVAAVVSARIAEAADAAEADAAEADAVDHHHHAPGDAFFAFLARMWRDGREKRDLVDALTGAGVEMRDVTATDAARLRSAAGTLLSRAQWARAVRSDVSVDDLFALLAGAYLAAARVDRATGDRLFRVLVDGLKPPAAPPPRARAPTRARRR